MATVRKGDSWIRIANRNKLNLDDLLYWNGVDPASRETLPELTPGQTLYMYNPYYLDSAYKSAEAPKDYVDYGSEGQEEINKWILAIKQNQATIDDVPDIFKTAVLQKSITNSTDNVAKTIGRIGANGVMLALNPVGYLGALGTQKAAAYINDAASGRHEYGTGDLFGATPIMGTQYAIEHPGKSMLIDMGAGLAGGTAVSALQRNIRNIINGFRNFNPRNTFQRMASGTGMSGAYGRQAVQTTYQNYADNLTRAINNELKIIPKGGTQYRGSFNAKGIGKTGTSKSLTLGGFKPNISSKGNFGNTYQKFNLQSLYPKEFQPGMVPVTPGTSMIPVMPVTNIPVTPELPTPIIRVLKPEAHIYQQEGYNRWQLPNPSGKVRDFIPGTGSVTIFGHAPFGNTPQEQTFTNETLGIDNSYAPSFWTKVPGSIDGTPSDYYSTATFEEPARIKRK